MHLAQGTEIADVAKGWGDQLPALGLGLLGMLVLIWLFLRYLGNRDAEARAERAALHQTAKEERESRDALFAKTIQEASERAALSAQRCHDVQASAIEREREVVEVLSDVKGTLSTTLAVTQDLGKVVEEAKREIELSRRELERHRP